jgi:hypothetical protein
MTRETAPIAKLYKTLVFIGIVVGPIYWLMFTDDGKRRTDTMVLWLAGGQTIEMNFKALDSHYKPEDWQRVYDHVEWQCQDSNSSLGNRLCYAEIASYNGIPSNYLSVFFQNNVTNAVKLAYRDQYHNEIGRDLVEQLGKPVTSQAGNDPNNHVLQWQTRYGQVLLKKSLQRGEEPVLIWLAQEPADNNQPAISQPSSSSRGINNELIPGSQHNY